MPDRCVNVFARKRQREGYTQLYNEAIVKNPKRSFFYVRSVKSVSARYQEVVGQIRLLRAATV